MLHALSVTLPLFAMSTPAELFAKTANNAQTKRTSNTDVYYKGENVTEFAKTLIAHITKNELWTIGRLRSRYPAIANGYFRVKAQFKYGKFLINASKAKLFQDHCYELMANDKNLYAPLLLELKRYQKNKLKLDSPKWIELLFKIENRCLLLEKIKKYDESLRRQEKFFKGKNKFIKSFCSEYTAKLQNIKGLFPTTDNNTLRKLITKFHNGTPFKYIEQMAKIVIASKLNKEVKKAGGKQDFSDQIDKKSQQLTVAIKNNDENKIKSLFVEVDQLCKEIILTHPKLQFKDLLVNMRQVPRYSHNVDQYLAKHAGICPGITIIKEWKNSSRKVEHILQDKLPKGSFSHPELSYDGKKVLFEYADFTEPNPLKRRYFIYEAAIDGSWVRQITGSKNDNFKRLGGRYTQMIQDFDPTYLPNGRIAFTSTRSQNVARCHGRRNAPAFLIYSANLDGSDIRPLTFGEANETVPTVLSDGRILYNRWEYINRHDTQFHMMWAMNPDGTNNKNYYGNLTVNPYSIMNPREVPSSHGTKIIGTATAHHSFANGSIILIDRNKGEEGAEPITRLTANVCFPESEGTPTESYATPYPITEDLFLVSYTPNNYIYQTRIQEPNAFGLYLAFNLGEKILGDNVYKIKILDDPKVSVFSPIPIQKREAPPVIPSSLDPNSKSLTGTYFIQNVYESTANIPKGTIKRIRINEILNQPTPWKPNRGAVANEATKKIIGTVPVNSNGSAYFEAPASKPLQLQLLDENGEAVMTMRSFIYLHPGEFASCLGCHEQRDKTPIMDPRNFRLRNLKLSKITPPAGPTYAETEGFNFGRTVQPVLDKHCISCHGLNRKNERGNVNLIGHIKQQYFGHIGASRIRTSISYATLVNNNKIYKRLMRNRNEPAYSTYKDFFSPNSILPKMLRAGHGKTKLTKDEIQRVIDWLDVNAQFYGNYSYNRPEYRKINQEGVKKLKQFVKETFGEKTAQQPTAALINHSDLSLSRILLAPLAIEAGGWGQMYPLFKSKNDPKYQKLVKLVNDCLEPMISHDIEGTCGRGPQKCVCGSCLIREQEKEYEKIQKKEQ